MNFGNTSQLYFFEILSSYYLYKNQSKKIKTIEIALIFLPTVLKNTLKVKSRKNYTANIQSGSCNSHVLCNLPNDFPNIKNPMGSVNWWSLACQHSFAQLCHFLWIKKIREGRGFGWGGRRMWWGVNADNCNWTIK